MSRRSSFPRHRLLVTGVGAALLLGASTLPVTAAPDEARANPVLRVSTLADLRDAVATANTRPGPDRIVLRDDVAFTPGEVPKAENNPARGDLDVTDDLVVDGRSHLLDANLTDRLFDVRTPAALTLVDLRMREGNPVRGSDGGAVRSTGDLTLVRVRVVENSTPGGSGGGVAVVGASLKVTGSTFTANRATGPGGAVAVSGVGTSTFIGGSVLQRNSGELGGAVHVAGDAAGDALVPVTLERTRLVGNGAVTGGGLWVDATRTSTDDLDVSRNTATGAASDQGGGGIYASGGTLALEGGSVSDNVATGAAGSGGGLLVTDGVVDLDTSVLDSNYASRAGGGIELLDATAYVRDSTITQSRLGTAPGNGGAVHLTGSGQVNVFGSTFTQNRAIEGGALWNSPAGTMTVQQSTFTNNSADGLGADQGGGAIYNEGGVLNVDGTTFWSNRATGPSFDQPGQGSGGAILTNFGELNVSRSVLAENRASRAGGAIEAVAARTTVSSTSFKTNEAGDGLGAGNGGALHLTGDGVVQVDTSTLTDNRAQEGGALWNSAEGEMTVTDSTFRDNLALGDAVDQGGAALYNDGGSLAVYGAVLNQNRALGVSASGGGIFNNLGALVVGDSRFTSNGAPRAGGGIETNVGTVQLSNVDMVGNQAAASFLNPANPGRGGALHVTGAGVVTWSSGRVTSGFAAQEGGGLWNSSTGTITATGFSVCDNSAPVGPNVFTQPGGTFTINGTVVPAGDNDIATC